MLLDLTLGILAAFAPSILSKTAPLSPTRESSPTRRPEADAIEGMHLQTSDKLTLAGTFYAPSSRGDVKAPGAILIHDAGGRRESLDDLARYLQRKGFGVLTLDLRGHGESLSDRIEWDTMDERTRQATWSLAIRDVQAAAEYLRDRREIHSSNLSLIGVEAGSALAVRQALDDSTVRAVVLFQPPPSVYGFDLKSGLEDLAGLPTVITSTKGLRDEASRFVNAAHGNGEGAHFVDLMVSKEDEAEQMLADSSLRNSLAKWLREHVMAKKR